MTNNYYKFLNVFLYTYINIRNRKASKRSTPKVPKYF